MGFIVDILGSIFGYILWFFFDLVSNYSIAITLFTIVISMIMLPIAIKRQKQMALNSRINVKQQELKKRYEKDPKKYNEEITRLYEKEGINPMGGCFSTMLLPLILWSGIFGAITKPLQNTLHIDSTKVNQAVTMLKESGKVKPGYEQLQLVRQFNDLKDELTMFNEEELADIEEYSSGFNFFGINLLNRPNAAEFSEMLWVIPLLCFLSSIFSMYINQKMSGADNQAVGCMKFMPYGAALFTTYIAFTIPAAVGLYWFVNGLIGIVQSFILNKYYNIYTINAHSEAARLTTLEFHEAEVHRVRIPMIVRDEMGLDYDPTDKKVK